MWKILLALISSAFLASSGVTQTVKFYAADVISKSSYLQTKSTNTVVLLAFVLILTTPVWAQNSITTAANSVYVSADADNDGDGSRDRPFLSLSQAEAASAVGDTIFLIRSKRAKIINGGIALKPQQRLVGIDADGQVLRDAGNRVVVSNTTDRLDGVMVLLSEYNEVAGIHFMNMRNYAISTNSTDFSGTYIHHSTFSGNASQHIEDERGLVYAVSLDASEGDIDNVRIEDSQFYEGEDLGAIRVFHSGDSQGRYYFRGNDFSDLGGRAYFVRSMHSSKIETVIVDSSADNIGRGDRNSDSIIPYLMGQSEQVMLIQNYYFNNTKQVGNGSNTGIEAYLFGSPRDDTKNWCTGCKLTLKIVDSIIENAVTDPIQFSNAGTNSQLTYEIRNTQIIGGNPRQGGGGISLNLQGVADSNSRTTLLVENTDIIGTTGYGLSINNRGGGDNGYTAVIDFGGGSLGSLGGNRFIDNAKGAIRTSQPRISARNNWWNKAEPDLYRSDNEPLQDSKVDFLPVLSSDPR